MFVGELKSQIDKVHKGFDQRIRILEKQRKDAARRLRVIEGALGIDLDSNAECSGDPTECSAEGCSRESCPMANSYVQQLLGFSKTITDRVTLVMAVLKELDDLGRLPPGILRLAQCRVDEEEAAARLEVAKQEGADPSKIEQLTWWVEEARSRYSDRFREARDALTSSQD